jgi:two-component system chemotaxis response regulator CheB
MTPVADTRMIRVLVAEDSRTARELLVHLINSDAALQVVGIATDGEQAVLAAQRLQPDVITMDIHMPKMDGYAAARRIMETAPTRIVMVTEAPSSGDAAATFDALAAGVLTVIAKPRGPGHSDYHAAAAELLATIKLMAEVSVVRRWTRQAGAASATPTAPPAPTAAKTRIRMVAIGASTGGPLVLQTILQRLSHDFGAPVLIVQHIPAGFAAGFVEWLSRSSGFPIRIPAHGDYALPGTAYFAPDNAHMMVRADNAIVLDHGAPEHGLRPAVSCLFRSVASAYGPNAAGVLLTGMGRDGAQELKLMQQAGAVTIVQDRRSAIVYGMPGEAVRLEAANHVLPPADIAATLETLVRKSAP